MSRLVIIGASGQGKVAADIAVRSGKYDSIEFWDDNESLTEHMGFPVSGPVEYRLQTDKRDTQLIVAIGNAVVRRRLLEQARELGYDIPNLIHDRAVIAADVKYGYGNVVMAGAVVNSGARIGNGCILNTGCSVDHDCTLGDYVHVSVGAHVAGTVVIQDDVWVGAGAVINNNLEICRNVMIGSGAVVVKNIEQSGTYVGVPAKLSGQRD